MSKQINLIPKITEEQLRSAELNKLTSLISVLILGATFVLVVGTFVYKAYLSYSVEQVKKQTILQTKELEALKTKESVLKGIELKLSKIGSLYENYPKFSVVLREISSLTNNEVLLADTEVKEDGNFSLTLKAKTRSGLERFLDSFTKLVSEKNYKDVKIADLTVVPNESYRVNMKFRGT